MKSILGAMGVRSALSTAYHLQTNGTVEWLNQELEQYLQVFCNRNQDNWVELLPYAELSHNIKEHAMTKKSPFEILNRRKPEWPTALRTQSEMQLAENHIKQINAAREEAQASMKIAADSIQLKGSIHGVTGLELKKGDKVWLEGDNLKNSYPTVKLAPKRFGTFEIEEEVGTGAYQLKLQNVEQQPPHSGRCTHAHLVELTSGERSKQGLHYRAIRASLYTCRRWLYRLCNATCYELYYYLIVRSSQNWRSGDPGCIWT
jgi:hypothetical protein